MATELAKRITAIARLRIPCECGKEWTVDQLAIGIWTVWTCDYCCKESRIERISKKDFLVEPTGRIQTPVTVTLESATTPKITVKLHAWKYAHSQDQSPEEYADSQRYFYDEHTCPTNWTDEIAEIIFEDDNDPHGVFQFVSVEDGHLAG